MSKRPETFLIDRDPVRWSAPDGFPTLLKPAGLFHQETPGGLEVVLATASRRPKTSDLRRAWLKRRAGRAAPVLLLVFYPDADGDRIALCGPSGEKPVAHHDLDPSHMERLAAVALAEPNHHAANRFLLAALAELGSKIPGLRNVGLLATHELSTGVQDMAAWPEAATKAAPLLRERGRRLVERLGYQVQTLGTNTSMLSIGGRNRAVAVFCNDGETFDAPAPRFEGASPVSRGLAVADQHNVDWLILTRAAEIRLYAARSDTGVGRKGRSETFVEVNLSLLPSRFAGYLHLLFSADALVDGGTLDSILSASERFAAALATRLRERVYFDTVPALARAVARRLDPEPSDRRLDEAYEQVMLILFRLLFVAYAEDKDLLPYHTNNNYHHHSLKLIAQRLLDDRRSGKDRYDKQATSIWDDVRQLWDAVDQGNIGWGVPAYDGGLFSDDPALSPAGARLRELRLSDAEFAPALGRLLIDETPEGEGPVDFRELSVREFGTIYEGLLESRLAIAGQDLTARKVKGRATYVPARPGEMVEVPAGSVYLHNRLGVRKATGSYFTKPFAVKHLLGAALDKALDHHIGRLDRLREADDEAALAAAFFDFRCADIAMGSGHFLVAALDRIEARLSAWLALHPVPAVVDELNRLRNTALRRLGDLGAGVDIESGSLIRRQVARHCVYGVDRNRVAVELARLAIWVHTFVPGLPLSFLDHNLICGDSLTGVGTLDEVVAEFQPGSDPAAPSLFRSQLEDLLARSTDALTRLARTSDATKREIDQARQAHREAGEAVAGANALFHVVAAHRAGVGRLPENYDENTIVRLSRGQEVKDMVARLKPVHFPARFPEVFLRERPGFDCILGNPPWEKAKVEKQQWWGRRQPGIRALSVGKMNAVIKQMRRSRPDLDRAYKKDMAEAKKMAALLRRTFDLGAGDTDLYQAFGWRFWQLVADGGAIGVVLPRQALAAPGYRKWRRKVLAEGTFNDITVLLNTGGWVFDDAEHRYTIALCTICRGADYSGVLGMRGPYSSRPDYRQRSAPTQVEVEEFLTWTTTAAFPLLPSEASLDTFRKMRRRPRLDGQTPDSSIRASGHPGIRASGHPGIRGGGGRGRMRSCTRPPIAIGSSSTVASPPVSRTRLRQRQAPLHP